MLASVMLAAALSAWPASAAPGIDWQTDYSVAVQKAQALNRPVAVFIGRGPAGWKQVAGNVPFDSHLRKLLSDKLVCVYLDRDETLGRSAAEDFGAHDDLPLLIVSDKTRKFMETKRKGAQTPAELVRALESPFAAPVEHRSYYQPPAAPVYGGNPFGNPGFGGPGCST